MQTWLEAAEVVVVPVDVNVVTGGTPVAVLVIDVSATTDDVNTDVGDCDVATGVTFEIVTELIAVVLERLLKNER